MQNLIDFDDDAKKENDNFLGMIQKIYSVSSSTTHSEYCTTRMTRSSLDRFYLH